MILIIAEKPSVGREIARVLKVTGKGEGYLHGNDYAVTWAYGHLLTLALPQDYGFDHPKEADLPLIPNPVRLMVRRNKTAKGHIIDPAANRQLKVIGKLAAECQSIIVATDAGREGELIFRYLYKFLGSAKPFQRLWISSLTDEAIRNGFANLKEGSHYDNLYAAADCRARADWLVGINASIALGIVTGIGNNSLGRVQTPTLAMIALHWLDNKNFVPSPYWQLKITLEKQGIFRHFDAVMDYDDLAMAEERFVELKKHTEARITKVEQKRSHQRPPLLYDLTGLQKDANVHFGLTAERTLEIAQQLYEHKLISYPRTGSRYISGDMAAGIPHLLDKILNMPEFLNCGEIDKACNNAIDSSKVTDHHALITTGLSPAELADDQRKVYCLVAGRMLEAFSPDCIKQVVAVEAECGNELFTTRSSQVITPGWRAVYSRETDKDEDEQPGDAMPAFVQDEVLPVGGYNMVTKKTVAKPLYTEATLLTAMESAGCQLSDKGKREAIKGTGLGTPATIAAIISTLLMREYVERSGRQVIPTEKGLEIYKAVKGLRIADVEMTASWEQDLTAIENGERSPETFDKAIEIYTRQITAEILALSIPKASAVSFPCPKCGQGNVKLYRKIAKCDNPDCTLVVFRQFLNKKLTDQHFEQLFSAGKTKLIKGFEGKRRNAFDAYIRFDAKFNAEFAFPKIAQSKAVKPKPKVKK